MISTSLKSFTYQHPDQRACKLVLLAFLGVPELFFVFCLFWDCCRRHVHLEIEQIAGTLNELSKNTLCKLLYSTMVAVLLFSCIMLTSPLYLKNLKELKIP